MMAPAKEAQGMVGSLIKRHVEATTICFAVDDPPPPQATSSDPSGGGGEPGFALRLTCHVTMYIRAGHGPPVVRSYRCGSGGAQASCFVVPGSGEDGVRDALRGMLRSVRALQDLGLTDAEWEFIVPEDVVPQLAGARHGAAEVHLEVVRRVRYDAARVLMTGCKKVVVGDDDGGAAAGKEHAECSVCYDALRRGEAVELPGCAHAFHCRCISEWFRRKPTCPLCRGDVMKHLDPELQRQIAELTDDAM